MMNDKETATPQQPEVNGAATENTDVPTSEDVGAEPHPETNADTAALEAQIAELKDKQLRLMAEFTNYKRRTGEQRLELTRTAAQETLQALLPVLDDFDRAKANADKPDTEEQFSDGVQLVYDKLYKILGNRGLKPMDSTGEPFDPDLHEALTEIPAPTEDLKGKVVDTIERGFYLGDKIIRHAKVVVGK